MTKWTLITGLVLVAGCAQPERGVLIMAHGGDAAWNEAVEQTVAPLRAKYPVELAFGMADSSTMRVAIAKLEARGVREIAVVRMFISGESFLPETEYILGLRDERPTHMLAAHPTPAPHGAHTPHAYAAHGDGGSQGHHMAPLEPIDRSASLFVSRQGVAESPLVDEILADRVAALSTDPSRESVLILAHGPGDDGENDRWVANMERRVRHLRADGGYREIRCETLREDWPEKRAEAEQRIRRFVEDAGRDGRVLVVPFRIAGFGPYAEVLEGLDFVADGRGFCPHPNMMRWIEQTAAACFARR